MDFRGILLADKPKGITSHDVVDELRQILGIRAIGHTGTLDPLASGLLVLLLGGATKLAPFLQGTVKEYLATIVIGIGTDTWDTAGQIVAKDACPTSRSRIEAVLTGFKGTVDQAPPPISAIKYRGQPMYRRARRGEKIELATRKVTFFETELTSFMPGDFPEVTLRVVCSAGTYVRSLARDVGKALDCQAALKALRRLRAGAFTLEQALSLKDIAALAERGKVGSVLISMSDALTEFPLIKVGSGGRRLVLGGHKITAAMVSGEPEKLESGRLVRVIDENGGLLAVAKTCPEATGGPEADSARIIAQSLRVFPANET